MISKRIVYVRDFAQEAAKLATSYGSTNLYGTSDKGLNDYLYGGYGRQDGYEIVILFGEPGVGKSMVALNLLHDPIVMGKKVGFMVLEDDGGDVFNRLMAILGKDSFNQWAMKSDNLHFMPSEAVVRAWTLDELLEMIEEWFTKRDLDIILLDHLQFAFENAEAVRGENEYIAQRIFMRKLNFLMKRIKKTIILVSHVNKANNVKGMGKIVGSGGIAGAATKILEVTEGDLSDSVNIYLRKTRFTKKRNFHYTMKLVDGKMESAA
jgi:predicted ATP-dependent serine protease